MSAAAGTETVGLVQQFVERAGQLYSLPAAAAEVLRLANQPRVDPREIKECLERDPALTARILRVVNSSLFGPSRPVTDLNQALTLLGIRPLKMVVLGFSLPKALFTGLEAAVLRRYWRQALVKAVAARELAEQLWHVPGDEPFLAGLVQDIGVLALIQQLGEPYVILLDQVQKHAGSLCAAELETLGFDHLVLSARLLMHWGLPAGLAAAISVPADETRIRDLTDDERALPRMLHLAELLVRLTEQPQGHTFAALLDIGGRYCGLTFAKVEPIVATLERKVAELAEVLSLELPPGQHYLDLLLEAQRRLADEALVAAGELAAPQPEDELLSLAARLQNELALASRRPGAWLDPAEATLADSGRIAPQRGLRRPDRPRREHSPGLGTDDRTADPTLLSSVTNAAQRCRQGRQALSLVLVEIDRFSDALLQLGAAETATIVHELQTSLARWSGQPRPALRVSDSRLAMLWEDCPRSDAVRLARQALASAPAWTREELGLAFELTLSCGIATLEIPPPNFVPQQLIDAAGRCLSGAALSGGDTVKSIEL